MTYYRKIKMYSYLNTLNNFIKKTERMTYYRKIKMYLCLTTLNNFIKTHRE